MSRPTGFRWREWSGEDTCALVADGWVEADADELVAALTVAGWFRSLREAREAVSGRAVVYGYADAQREVRCDSGGATPDGSALDEFERVTLVEFECPSLI